MLRIASIVLLATLVAAPTAASGQTRPAAPPTSRPEAAASVYVMLKTSKGDILLELDAEKAPKSVANFLSYVDEKTYDGTIFHRVISNFMIQGGGFNEDMQKRPTGKGVENEWKNGLKNVRGSVAMARLGGRPDSGTNQFFINVKDNGFLDMPRDGAGYAVFGKVAAGMDVVDAIKAVPTGVVQGRPDVPLEPVVIREARRMDAASAEKLIKGAGDKPANGATPNGK